MKLAPPEEGEGLHRMLDTIGMYHRKMAARGRHEERSQMEVIFAQIVEQE